MCIFIIIILEQKYFTRKKIFSFTTWDLTDRHAELVQIFSRSAINSACIFCSVQARLSEVLRGTITPIILSIGWLWNVVSLIRNCGKIKCMKKKIYNIRNRSFSLHHLFSLFPSLCFSMHRTGKCYICVRVPLDYSWTRAALMRTINVSR